MEHREHHLLGLGRVFGLERDHEKEKDDEQKSKERGEGWREFKPGKFESLPLRLPSRFPCLANGSPGINDFTSQVPIGTRFPSCFRPIFHRRFLFLMHHLTTPSKLSLTDPAHSHLSSLAKFHL